MWPWISQRNTISFYPGLPFRILTTDYRGCSSNPSGLPKKVTLLVHIVLSFIVLFLPMQGLLRSRHQALSVFESIRRGVFLTACSSTLTILLTSIVRPAQGLSRSAFGVRIAILRR